MSKMTSRLLATTALANAVVRADEDEKEHREDASAGTRESTEIMDAVGRCMDAVERMADSFGKRLDRVDARLDAVEGGEDEKREDKRKDASEDEKEEREDEDEDEDEEKREDKRKDGEDDEKEEKREDKRRDSARRDEDEKEERREDKRRDSARRDEDEDEKEEAHADSASLAEIRAEVRRLSEDNARLARLVPRPMTDADAGQLLQAQALADEVYVELGKRAPAPLVNEDLTTYRRRVAVDLQQFSPTLKGADLWAVADSASFDTLEKVIYGDALEAARNPADPGPNRLRAVKRSNGGHEFTEYYGDSAGWMGDLAFTATRGVASVTEMMKAGQGR